VTNLVARLRDPEMQWPSGDPTYMGLRKEAADEIERQGEIIRLYRMIRPVGEPPADGYRAAFFQIAEVLGMEAMPISPKEAFETAMLPLLRKLAANRGR